MIDAQEVLRSTRKVELRVELTGRQAAALYWSLRQVMRRASRAAALTPQVGAVEKIVAELADQAQWIMLERAARHAEDRE